MKKSGFGNRAQVTIFIIFAILIVVGITSFYFLVAKPSVATSSTANPQAYIEGCVQKEVVKVLPLILEQGGIVNPEKTPDKSVLYEDKYVRYLCYSEGKKEKCIINTPLLKSKIEEEVKKATTKGIEKCFEDMRKDYSGYDYKERQMTYSVEISPEFLTAKINKEITISKGDSVQQFNLFVHKEPSSLFDFILLTNDILVQEVGCVCGEESCTADVLELSLFNKNFEISVFVAGSGEKVYTIKDTRTQQQYKFAVRNCIK